MLKQVLVIIFACLICYQTLAVTTTCKIDSRYSFKAIRWESDSGEAKVIDFIGDVHSGNVTLSRKHDKGIKVNILVKYSEPFYGVDASEFIVFTTDENTYRVIGIGHKIHDGKYYLEQFHGNDPAECILK